jgi:hypothetical protein
MTKQELIKMLNEILTNHLLIDNNDSGIIYFTEDKINEVVDALTDSIKKDVYNRLKELTK